MTLKSKPEDLPVLLNLSEMLKSLVGASAQARWRRFIVDSGASFHMIRRDHLTDDELATLRPGTPIKIRTAAGIVWIKQVVDVVVHALGDEPLQFYVLEDTVELFLKVSLFPNMDGHTTTVLRQDRS